MAEHDDKAGTELLCSELHAADLGSRDDIAGDANHKQVAEILVENQLDGNTRIRAPEDDGERLLSFNRGGSPDLALRQVATAGATGKPQVTFTKSIECLRRWNHRCIVIENEPHTVA